MMTTLFGNVYSNNNQAAHQSETASCAKKANLVHSATLCAVCTFIFAVCLMAVQGALGVLISVAIISIIAIIGRIIIMADNRIYKGNGPVLAN